MYTQDSIDKIRDVDIVDLIQNYVELKKAGANYKGLSPFKSESTPSFMVSPVKNIFKCFASGYGGDGIKFIQLIEGCNFQKAIEIIAEKCNVYLEKEFQTEEQIKTYEESQDLKELCTNVSKEYCREWYKLPKDHWAKMMMNERGYDESVCIEFQLGFASSENLVSKAVVKSAKLELSKDVGLVKVKNGTSYDFFRDRIVFPIMNRNGQVVAFGGRRSNDKEVSKYPKYLNSPESKVYNKSKVLYGLHLAAINIKRTNTAILVEGYTDVISMHSKGANNTVATCGTALTSGHAEILRRLSDHVILFRDGDSAGLNALLKDIDVLLPTGVRVSVLKASEGEDPDTIAQGQVDMGVYVKEYAIDAVLWKAEYLLKIADDNPTEKANALAKTIETLCKIDSKIVRDEYVKDVSKLYEQNVRTIQTEIKSFLSEEYERRKRQAKRDGTDKTDNLPEGADANEYFERGFCTIGNAFHMKTKDGWKDITNFKMTPLFHIKGGSDTPRLFDVVNTRGKRALVEVPSSVVLNQSQMQSHLLDYGFFTFDVNTSNIQFKTIMVNLIQECIEAKPFSYFGWQSKGFWAFANGIYQKGKFHEVNKYGIVVVEGLEQIQSEYYDNTPNYYSPAFNESNKFADDDQDDYENDRAFVYKESPISLEKWMSQVTKVYGDKGNLAIAFCVASLFRDFVLSRYSFFPHLFLSGEKDSGKSKFGDTIHKLFTYKLAPFDLNSGTVVGFYRRLARLKNVPAFFEEYHDKIDDRMFQSIKAAYDGRGREKGSMTNDNRTQISKVNSSMVIASQYLPNRDDNSVSSRSIIISFQKRDDYNEEELKNYDLLKEWEEQGLSSLVLDIVKHRNLIEQNFHDAFAKNRIDFKDSLGNNEYKERILNNYNALYTPVSILFQCFNFPFSLQSFYDQCIEGIKENSSMLTETEGLSEFWNTLEKLFERGIIKEGTHFKINKNLEETIIPSKGEKTLWKNTENHKILYLRLNSVHQDYVNEVSRRDGTDVISEGALRNYFRSKKYYIGMKKGHRFGQKVTSCFCFDYDLLLDLNIVNLDPINPSEAVPRYNEPELFNSKKEVHHDEDMPFPNTKS